MKTIKWLDRNFEILLMVCALLVIVFVMGAQVVARKFLGASIEWSEEMGRYLFVWMGFLSISYTLHADTIIRLEILDTILPASVLKFLRVLVQVFMLVMFTYLTCQSFSIVRSTNQRWSSIDISMNYVYGAIPFCFALTVLRLAQGLILTLRSKPDAKNAKAFAAKEEAEKSRMTEMRKDSEKKC